VETGRFPCVAELDHDFAEIAAQRLEAAAITERLQSAPARCPANPAHGDHRIVVVCAQGTPGKSDGAGSSC
jgi:hypothetical protein